MGLVYPYVFRFLDGVDFLFGKIAMGWLGGWLGSPVLGHWFWKIEDAYVVPSILGAGAAIHLSVLWWKAAAKAFQVRSTGVGGLVAYEQPPDLSKRRSLRGAATLPAHSKHSITLGGAKKWL